MKFDFHISNIKSEEVKKDKKSSGNYIDDQQEFRQFEDIQTFEDAVLTAQNLTNPDRTELNRIYDEIECDPHFSAQWETRKMKTIEREFAIYDNHDDEEHNEELTKLFKSAWFHDFMHLALDSMKRGFILVEFGRWNGKGFDHHRDDKQRIHKPVQAVNFNHVKPEFGYLVKNQHDQRGLDLFKPPVSNRTIFIGQPRSFGLLFKCTRYILFKNNCLNNWSEFAEKFGLDTIIGTTEQEGSAFQKFFKSLKNITGGGAMTKGHDDSIEFVGTSRTDAYQVYKELQEYVDKAVSKLIFGQDVVMDHSGRVKGTVAENITDLYGNHDSKFLEGIINDELIPKMAAMGAPVEGKVFKWDNTESLTLKDRVEIDLKISQMGKNLDDDYLMDTYGTVLGDSLQPRIANPEEVAKELKNIYGGS